MVWYQLVKLSILGINDSSKRLLEQVLSNMSWLTEDH